MTQHFFFLNFKIFKQMKIKNKILITDCLLVFNFIEEARDLFLNLMFFFLFEKIHLHLKSQSNKNSQAFLNRFFF